MAQGSRDKIVNRVGFWGQFATGFVAYGAMLALMGLMAAVPDTIHEGLGVTRQNAVAMAPVAMAIVFLFVWIRWGWMGFPLGVLFALILSIYLLFSP